jgi:MEDS: MEthanogen/methylotroph, DcmR Sensory domain
MHDHQVQFYEQDAFLIEGLAKHFGEGLEAGHACIVIATPEHRAELEKRLRLWYGSWGWSAALRSDRYIALDADETLAKFMVDGSPSLERFTELVLALLGRATRDGSRQVLAFGEMVALLWADGNHQAAALLERLWDDLVYTHALSLLCAYPVQGFNCEEQLPYFQQICRAHTRIHLANGSSCGRAGAA